MSNNGKSELTTAEMPLDQILDILVEAVTEINLKQDEILEKLANLSTPGVDYSTYEDDL